MDICPNCCEELQKKKYRQSNRLKCMACGYETSNWEIEKEAQQYLDLIDKQKSELYRQNELNNNFN